MRRGMRRRERITNVSLLSSLPSFLPPSFSFSSPVPSASLSRARGAPYTHPEILFTWKFQGRRPALPPTVQSDRLASRRHDAETKAPATTFRISSPYSSPAPSELSDRTKILSRVLLPFSFLIPAFPLACRPHAFSYLS